MAIQYIDQIENLNGKKIFMRVDFNVPLDDNQNITEDTRIRAVLPTITYALDRKAKVVLASHLGRPKGERKSKYSMAPAAERLSQLLGKKVTLAPDCIGDEVARLTDAMQPGDIIMLENVRFYPGEEKNDEEFARALADGCEIYVNDAFAVSHRAHASVEAITRFFPVVTAGFLMKNEMTYFEKVMTNPVRPLVAILGGAKVSGKLEVLESLCTKVDKIIIGGGMAFTFLKALGNNVGKSLVEEELIDTAMRVLNMSRERGIKFLLPVDCVVADRFSADAETKITTVQEIPQDWMALDIGPASVKLFSDELKDAETIVWNGPMGVFEMDAFAKGTFDMVSAVADSSAITIVGGGDTDVAVQRGGQASKISYISTGGGAFLELLEGKKLPGIKVLEEKGTK
ncbi:phosphoglycerate kinase [Geobacter sp. DSM 9736]|uniref:phosphoglycerate kinase n=1 Tax=Geobacter sp. DSM 9736 TaxID=1277350 RepID=UPI000B500BCC|nr:phosphoglycerate kinase [Geobacter sp. DSM 9736]SNB45581.1 phosphoglycerate kinase [Geobacter sp. DSM 9736]